MSIDHLFFSQPYGDSTLAEFFGSTAEIRGDDPASILQIANSKPESLSSYIALANPDKSTPDKSTCYDQCNQRFPLYSLPCRQCCDRGGTTESCTGSIGGGLLPDWLANPDAKKWLIVGIGAILILIGINAALR